MDETSLGTASPRRRRRSAASTGPAASAGARARCVAPTRGTGRTRGRERRAPGDAGQGAARRCCAWSSCAATQLAGAHGADRRRGHGGLREAARLGRGSGTQGWTAGPLVSSAPDMARFLSALLDGGGLLDGAAVADALLEVPGEATY
ncbi:hypothetical protein WMF38_25330 [Sorangium sp. So ce118]